MEKQVGEIDFWALLMAEINKRLTNNASNEFLEKIKEIAGGNLTEDNYAKMLEKLNDIPIKENAASLSDNELDQQIKTYQERLSDFIKSSSGDLDVSGDSEKTQKYFNVQRGLSNTLENLYVKKWENEPASEEKRPVPSIPNDAQPKPRPQTAEMGEKSSSKRGLFATLKENVKDKVTMLKLNFNHSITKQGYLKNLLEKEGTHIKTLDMNRYPGFPTGWTDYTKVDKVILPDPQKHDSLDLRCSKLKGNINLSAYNAVDLSGADLTQVTELDLSGCKNVNLEGLDLRNVKLKLPQPIEGSLYEAKLPKLDNVDLSQGNVNLYKTDFSQVNTVILPPVFDAERVSGFPKHLDASRCHSFNAQEIEMPNVEKITPPQVRADGYANRFTLSKCHCPNLKSLDLGSCQNSRLVNNNLPALETLKIRGGRPEEECIGGNKTPVLHSVKINKHRPFVDREPMFDTFRNIEQAVKLNQPVYKNAETGKICPVTENQKKAMEIINVADREHGQQLKKFWTDMAANCNDLSQMEYSPLQLHANSKQKQVLTEYNKALSQALGMDSYINMQTMKYEKADPLKTGEKLNIPSFSFTRYSHTSETDANLDKWGRKSSNVAADISMNAVRQKSGKSA